MARRLILDTGVLIESERGRCGLQEVIVADDDLVIAAITVAELRTGVELAAASHRASRAEFLVRVLETLPVEPYDLATANAHGRLLAHVHRGGTQCGAHDLVIAQPLLPRSAPSSPRTAARASMTCPESNVSW